MARRIKTKEEWVDNMAKCLSHLEEANLLAIVYMSHLDISDDKILETCAKVSFEALQVMKKENVVERIEEDIEENG